MWQNIGRFVLRFRILLLLLLAGFTAFMGYHASKVQLSYDFASAIPNNNPKYKAYQDFRKKFGEDGNLLAIGMETPEFFQEKTFNAYTELLRSLKKVNGVDDVFGVPTAINLVKDSVTERLKADTIFQDRPLSQKEIDS